MGTLLAIFGLGLMIFFHELGHFLAARAVGLPVLRFSIGMGPVIFSHRLKGVEWALSALPFGGYVLFDAESVAFENASPWRKVVTALAGPMANLVIGCLLFIMAASLSVHGLAIGTGLEKSMEALNMLFSTLYRLFSGEVGIRDLGGPVMMVKAGAGLTHDAGAFLSYLGFLSLNLGIFNLLPIPALDGGQILMSLATSFSGRRLSDGTQWIVVGGSFILLMGLIAWVTLQDVARLL